MAKEAIVGEIKNVVYDEESDDLEFTIRVTDPKFKKKLLRDLALSGNIKIDGTSIVYVPVEEEDAQV